MKNWFDLGGDVNWEDYGGKWGRKAPDGSWYVLDFTNMEDVCGKDYDGYPYICEVKRFDRASTPDNEIASALRSRDLKFLADGDLVIVNDCIVVDEKWREQTIVETCVSHGLGAPLESFGGKRASWVRAEARRYAERCMKNAALLEERLNRTVNAIGSTAREYGVGNISAALSRGPATPSKQLMRKISGMPPLKTAIDVSKCHFTIIAPEHYREDGSCKCDDAEHRKMMIEKWEYAEKSFSDIPLRT